MSQVRRWNGDDDDVDADDDDHEFFFFLIFCATAPPLGHGLLIHEVSRSHTTTNHCLYSPLDE